MDKIYFHADGQKQEATGEKLKEIQAMQIEAQEQQKRFELERQAQEELKQSAIAKLAKLGLTEDEAKAVIGIQ